MEGGSVTVGKSSKADDKEEKKTKEEEKTQKEINEFDLSTPCWFYNDSNGLKQGPFSFKEMFLWWKGGYFPNELLVKTIWETTFQELGQIPEFFNAPPKLIERIEKEQEELVKQGHIEVPMVPNYYEPKEDGSGEPPAKTTKYQEYSATGTFNSASGKFQGDQALPTRPTGPVDRDASMMSKFFDFDKYQGQMADLKKKKAKPVKGTKKFWKERKEKKRRAKLVAEWLAD